MNRLSLSMNRIGRWLRCYAITIGCDHSGMHAASTVRGVCSQWSAITWSSAAVEGCEYAGIVGTSKYHTNNTHKDYNRILLEVHCFHLLSACLLIRNSTGVITTVFCSTTHSYSHVDWVGEINAQDPIAKNVKVPTANLYTSISVTEVGCHFSSSLPSPSQL